jgi:cytochrome b pre-mRNA-processing protein 3
MYDLTKPMTTGKTHTALNKGKIMGIFSGLFGAKDFAKRDARIVYNALLKQSRQPEFFGSARFPDNYDGRIDVVTLHMALMLDALRPHEEQGARLSQAIFDEMKDDFEVALREEGISDTGVKKRIKPMIRLFYTRAKDYTQALSEGGFGKVSASLYQESDSPFSPEFTAALGDYAQSLKGEFAGKTLGQLAQAQIEFPSIGMP